MMRKLTQSPWCIALVRIVTVLAALAASVTISTAHAQPDNDMADLPGELRKYVPASPQWQRSSWMTAESCQDQGGDFSVWASNVIQDAPALLQHFGPAMFGPESSNPEQRDAVLRGYRDLAATVEVPSGYCVDDMKHWAGTDGTTKPFNFAWGLDPEHQVPQLHLCVSTEDQAEDRSLLANRSMGAPRGPCDGFYVSCVNADGADHDRCQAWNAFSDEHVRQVKVMRDKAWDAHPPELTGATKQVGVLDSMVGGWFEDLARSIATGAASLMAEAMTFWTQTDRTDMLESPAITKIQEMLRYIGIVLLAGSMIWQGIMIMYRRKVDPLVNTGMGLVSFVGWSTLGGAAAVLLNEGGMALASQVLDTSIKDFAQAMGDSLVGQVTVMTGAIFFLSIIVFFLACIQWVLGFFRMGALVILLALLPTAAAGQLNESTKPWLRKILSWCLALILYQPIAAIVFAIGLRLIGDAEGLSTVLVGMSVIALAVISMPTMLRFFDWGGQKLVNTGGGGGGAMALGAAAQLGGGGPAGFGRHMDHNGPAATGRGARTAGTGAMPVTAAHAGDGPSQSLSAGSAAGASSGAAAHPAVALGQHAASAAGRFGGAAAAAISPGDSATKDSASGDTSTGAATGTGPRGAAFPEGASPPPPTGFTAPPGAAEGESR